MVGQIPTAKELRIVSPNRKECRRHSVSQPRVARLATQPWETGIHVITTQPRRGCGPHPPPDRSPPMSRIGRNPFSVALALPPDSQGWLCRFANTGLCDRIPSGFHSGSAIAYSTPRSNITRVRIASIRVFAGQPRSGGRPPRSPEGRAGRKPCHPNATQQPPWSPAGAKEIKPNSEYAFPG